MRLWHTELIKKLPSKLDYKGCTNQLGGQWVEIRMIMSNIKNKGRVNHSTVNYVNNYGLSHLLAYGILVAEEMIDRGFNISNNILGEYLSDNKALDIYKKYIEKNISIYNEHDDWYYVECVNNLKSKGVFIE
jgi:uncharacterized protein (TIGR02328 family)